MKTPLTGANDCLSAYAAEKDGNLQVALINKGYERMTVSFDGTPLSKSSKMASGWILAGPSLESTQSVTLRSAEPHRHPLNRVSIPHQSALLEYLHSSGPSGTVIRET